LLVLKIWFNVIRPKTLSASVAPILLSQVLAYQFAGQFSWGLAVVISACGLFLQISANLANDYFDDKSGVDTALRLGPLRAMQTGLLTRQQLLQGMRVSIFVACMLGFYLIYRGGPLYLLLGLLSIAGVLSYSAGPRPLASHALGEVSVFVFFGPIAVLGALYLQFPQPAAPADLLPFLGYAVHMGLLAAAIMLVNNIRDIKTDILANKITLAVRLSAPWSRVLYTVLLISVAITAYFNGQANWVVIFALIVGLALARLIFRRQAQHLNRQLAQTAAFMLVWSLVNIAEVMLL